MSRRRGVRRLADGTYRVHLHREERDVLAALPGQLREAFTADEPSLYRLFPPAYAGDPAANVEYHRLVGEGLVDGRLVALAELERTAHAEKLTEEEAGAWLGALESLRLVLGTQLDVTEETYGGPIDPTTQDAQRLVLYHWLSWLQDQVVQALSDALP